jgi:RNA polymerase sigma-70 factor, ECF subfamily
MDARTLEPWPADERELIARLKALRDDAVVLVYRAHADPLYRYALARLGDQAAAEDVVSETFLRLLEAIGRYEERGVPLRRYVFRIAHNLIVDQLRARRPSVTLGEMAPGLADAAEDPAREIERGQARDALHRALATLTPAQREVVLLRFLGGLEVFDVAEVIGKNSGAVKSMQHRALAALRRTLERHGHRI